MSSSNAVRIMTADSTTPYQLCCSHSFGVFWGPLLVMYHTTVPGIPGNKIKNAISRGSGPPGSTGIKTAPSAIRTIK